MAETDIVPAAAVESPAMADRPALLWFRSDLRLDDHPALHAAVASGAPVVGLFVLDPAQTDRPLGAAQRWWLHHSLSRLAEALAAHGVPLLLRRGDSAPTVAATARAIGAGGVYWTAAHTPFLATLDQEVAEALRGLDIAVGTGAPDLLAPPDAVRSGSGQPYKVFTPFWNALRDGHPVAEPLPVPAGLRGPASPPAAETERLEDWALRPTRPDWAGGLRETWTPGEAGARARLDAFLAGRVDRYAIERDSPAVESTSRLSPHLRFGEISPRRVWHRAWAEAGGKAEPFLRELAWREFCHGLLFQEPALARTPLRREYAAFPFVEDEAAFRAWTEGRTGYPIVDAGMRELWRTGWMHNRVRMIVASFLVKDLLLPWQWGERWFWDTLVDADPANNPANWQWVSGCGADAAPYFRIFNPTLQGEKFDPRGHYVRRWVPELAEATDLRIHRPTDDRGLFGGAYPGPIVDHSAARRRALQAYERISGKARG